MKHERISVKSLSETIGNSTVTVRKALRKLEDAKTVTVEEEKRVRLHDGGYQAESRRYLVAHPCGDARGARMRVTMRELMLDFDRCYHEAIRTLIPQPAARQHLSAAEWQEHMSWQEGGGCIDQDSAGRTLHHPDFGELIVYEQGGRILYPACECAKKLGLANPGIAGSRCPGKELWQIKVAQRKRLHGTASDRMLGRNLIPAADVRRLASMSKDARRNEKYAWMTSLEKDGSDPQ